MATRSALTLVEILVSLTIGMVLVALGTSALLHVGKVFARNTALLQGHEDAAGIYQRLHATMETMYHPALMGLRADPGADSAWGTGDEVIEMTWMSTISSLDEGNMGYGPTPMNDLLWQRLQWTGNGQGGGTLSFANSGGRRMIAGWSYKPTTYTITPHIVMGPFVRRDRRRDLDDNDLRFLPGMDMATYTAVNAAGDGQTLDARLRPWHPATTAIATCVIEWIDGDGVVTRCDPAAGVSRRSATGSVIPPLGTAYSDGHNQVIDGAWLDGRSVIPAGDSRSSLMQRPILVRLSIIVVPDSGGRVRFADNPHLPFTFTFAAQPCLPPL